MFKKGISLRAQLYALVLSVIFLAFVLSLINNSYTFRDYLKQQLNSHAQDAATNLGLAIINQDPENSALINQFAQTLFASGYYQEISFSRTDGEVVLNLRSERPAAVPRWFRVLFPLKAPTAVNTLLDESKVYGELQVTSHTGLAEQTLFAQVLRNIGTTVVLFLLAALAVHVILRAILQPLQQVVQQARSVSRKRFVINQVTTSTIEVKSVITGLNAMVSNILQILNEQLNYSESLIRKSYIDEFTGLPNRKAFIDHLGGLQQETLLNQHHLYVALLKLPSLKEVNVAHGYAAGNAYLNNVTKLLLPLETRYAGLRLYRIAGAEFVLVAPCDTLTMTELDNELAYVINSQQDTYYTQGFALHGSVVARAEETASQLLLRLDRILTQKVLRLPVRSEFSSSFDHAQWQKAIEHFIHETAPDKYRLDIFLLPVFNAKHSILYTETMVRFLVDDNPLATTEVLGMANRLGLAEALEKRILTFLVSQLTEIKDTPIALNVSLAMLSSESLYSWLLTLLAQHRAQLPKLLIEMPEQAIFNSPKRVADFIDSMQQLDIEIVVERFAGNLATLQHIRDLNIDYVKVDPSLTHHLRNEHSQLILSSLTQICHSIGVKVIAAHLEDSESIAISKAMHIDGFQGFGLVGTLNINDLDKKLDATEVFKPYDIHEVLANTVERRAAG